MTPHDRELADEIATQAVTRTLLALGINISDPNAVIKQHRDFAFLRMLRESAIKIVFGILGAVAAACGGAVALHFGLKPPPH